MGLPDRGGYGAVYLGHWVDQPDRKVAVKIFHGLSRAEFVELEICYGRLLENLKTTPTLIDCFYDNSRFMLVG